MKTIKYLVAVAVLLLVVPDTNAQEDLEKCKESLQGIKSMSVRVVVFKDTDTKNVITTSTIKTDIELKLQSAGISVVPFDSSYPTGSLICTIDLMKYNDRTVTKYNIAFYQSVSIDRNSKIKCFSPTWQDTGFSFDQTKELDFLYRIYIRASVNDFLNDYLSVNPKK